MQKRICPICDHPMRHEHYCSFCRQWIKEPHYVNATYYLNERHPDKETDCEYHNMGNDTHLGDTKSGTDTENTLLERIVLFFETHSSTTAGRQPQHYKPNQPLKSSNTAFQSSQKKTIASKKGKQTKNSGKGIVKIIVILVAVMYVVNFLYNINLALLWWV